MINSCPELFVEGWITVFKRQWQLARVNLSFITPFTYQNNHQGVTLGGVWECSTVLRVAKIGSVWHIWMALSDNWFPKELIRSNPTQLDAVLQDGDCTVWSVFLPEGGNISFAVSWRGEAGRQRVNRTTHRKHTSSLCISWRIIAMEK